ncbi:putative bifunctional diguanylate cyclase/phosphodiesterase [Sinorhizobium meliloti]|uniref:putative bifunctional diguanylate cyclase/phosphodiesterase n=1 Tax=Rhizobium meliloti TaxID=382 RepID=UPI00398CC6FD
MRVTPFTEESKPQSTEEYSVVIDANRSEVVTRQVPLLNLVASASIFSLSFTHFEFAPVELSLFAPVLLIFILGCHTAWWLKSCAAPRTEEAERLAIRRAAQMSGVTAVLSAAWAIALSPTGDAYSQSHVVFFIALAVVGNIPYCTYFPSGGIAIALAINAALAALVAPSGNTVFIAVALNIALVSGVLLHILMGNYRDFTSLVQSQLRTEALGRENHRLANIDSLTDLPNRRSFFSRLSEECGNASLKQARLALGMLDLDGFKAVNDLYGHAIGDSLLAEVGRRLEHTCPGAFLARLGGDEFAIIVTDVQEDELMALGERICEKISARYLIDGIGVQVSVSAGFAIYPDHVSRPDLLFECADYALYEAKTNSTGHPVLFCEMHSFAIQRNARIEQALRDADLRAEIAVAFQPIVDLTTGRAVGFEALGRWESPALGDVSPAQFIPIAEKAGLVSEVTLVLLEKSLCAAGQWPQPFRLSFNLSPKDICSVESVLPIASIVLKSGFDPARIDFEITETAIINDFPQAKQAIEALKTLGCGISIDDFGTGYSTLSQLQTLPISKLKIDRSFVTELQERPTGYKIVKAVLSLAREMGIECIVEGVETEEELRALRKLGCRLVQGFHMSKPLDQEAAQQYAGAILIEPEKLLA